MMRALSKILKELNKLFLMVVVVIALVMALLFFFYFQSNRRRMASAEAEVEAVGVPEAHLEDVNQIFGFEDGMIMLDKEHINIGRGKRNDIILDQPAISGFHAAIEFRNMSFYLEGQRSTNGTLLNDRRLTPNGSVHLKSGDHITLAKFHFKFILADQKPFGDTIKAGRMR